LRILHLTDRLTDRGGAHVHLLGVLQALAARGHTLQLLAGAADARVEAPCEVRELSGLDSRDRRAVDLGPALAEFRPDLVHVHTVVNPDALEAAASGPSVITVQDHRYFCPARGKWTVTGEVCSRPLEAGACRACFDDGGYYAEILTLTQARLRALRAFEVVVLSGYMRDELVAVGLPRERVNVVPPFVHGLDAAARVDGPPCVLFVGRLTDAKGPLEAWEAWRRSGVELPLIFAGTGPLRTALEARGASVLGWMDRPRLSRLLRRARALLMPSRWQEPFGIAGLEARSFGVPVVAWRSGGIAEWCEPASLVPWGDLDGLAAALRRAVEGPAPVPFRGYDRDALIDRLEGVYRRAARGATL
jgi:glycosyltransferase involved in cell wall biosynthesis